MILTKHITSLLLAVDAFWKNADDELVPAIIEKIILKLREADFAENLPKNSTLQELYKNPFMLASTNTLIDTDKPLLQVMIKIRILILSCIELAKHPATQTDKSNVLTALQHLTESMNRLSSPSFSTGQVIKSSISRWIHNSPDRRLFLVVMSFSLLMTSAILYLAKLLLPLTLSTKQQEQGLGIRSSERITTEISYVLFFAFIITIFLILACLRDPPSKVIHHIHPSLESNEILIWRSMLCSSELTRIIERAFGPDVHKVLFTGLLSDKDLHIGTSVSIRIPEDQQTTAAAQKNATTSAAITIQNENQPATTARSSSPILSTLFPKPPVKSETTAGTTTDNTFKP